MRFVRLIGTKTDAYQDLFDLLPRIRQRIQRIRPRIYLDRLKAKLTLQKWHISWRNANIRQLTQSRLKGTCTMHLNVQLSKRHDPSNLYSKCYGSSTVYDRLRGVYFISYGIHHRFPKVQHQLWELWQSREPFRQHEWIDFRNREIQTFASWLTQAML